MSRADYSDDLDNWDLIRWRGAVASSFRGRRGQAALRDMAQAMDAMPVKELIDGELTCQDGMCALGVLASVRGVDFSNRDPDDNEGVAHDLDLSEAFVREVAFMNDEGSIGYGPEAPDVRWKRMRAWIETRIIKEPTP